MIKFYKKKKTVVRVSWALIYALFFNAALPLSLFATVTGQSGTVPEGYLKNSYVDDNSWVEQYINQSSGNNSFTEERLTVSCPGIALELDLTYESILSHPDSGVGSHWTHSYEWVLVNDDAGKALHTGDGSKYIFDAVSGGYDSPEGLNWSLEVVTSGYAVQLPGGKTYLFDSTGRLDAIEDAWGNSVQCNYDTNDCLSVVQHDNGRQLVFTNGWNSTLEEWRVESVTVPDGVSLAFSYDPDGQFTQVVEQVGNNSYTSTYEYADGLLTNRVDAAGFSYAYSYKAGSDGKCSSLSVDGLLEHEVDYVSDDVTDIISTMRGLEQRFRYSRNSDGMLETKYGPVTNTALLSSRGIRYEYATNNVDKIEKTLFDNNTDATWSKWMLYDDNHNVTNISMGYGTTNRTHRISMTYDADWQLPATHELADGARAETVYTNGSPAVVKTFYAPSQSYDTHYAYTTNGLLRSITKANDSVTELKYDGMGNLIAILPEIGPSLTNSYNARGDIESLEMLAESGESTGRIYHFDTDAHGRITEIVYPDGLSGTYAYNALGMMTNTVDRAGRATETIYGPTGQKTSVTKYLNQNGSNVPVRISYNYDEQFNTLSIAEPSGQIVESYQLDIQDRVTAVTNIEGQVMTLDYSIGDFITEINRFDGSTISNEYDQAGRLIDSQYSRASVPLASVSRTYWPDSQLKTIADGTTSVSNEYDRLNRLTNIVTTIGSFQSSIGNAYDPVGNLTNKVVVLDTSSTNNLTTSYSYDAAERLIGLTAKEREKTQNFQYTYNPENGQISSVTNLESGLVTSYAYDLMDRATNISYRTSTGTLIRSLDYEFDDVGMIQSIVFDNGSELTVKSYQYDSLDRLIAETVEQAFLPAQTTAYSYDLAGNRTSKVSNGWKTEYLLGTGNRLASSQTAAITNSLFVSGSANEPIGIDDRWGELWVTNLTSGAQVVPSVNGSTFAAEVPSIGNATNILVAAIRDRAGNMSYATNNVYVSSSGGSQASATAYEYDATGCLTNLNGTALTWDERYRLTRVDEASSLVSYTYDVMNRRTSRTENSNTVFFVYNDQQVVADLDSSNNVLRTYVWGQGIDNLLAFTDHTTSNTYYAIKDHQNTVLAFVDESGSVVESYEYDAWGNVTVFDSGGTEIEASNIGNRYLFQGREYDSSTGLYYFRARWYDPAASRWLSKDPIGIAGGLNQYVFCNNNPVNCVDPYGCAFSEWVGLGSIILAVIAMAVPEPASTAWGAASLSAAIHAALIARAENTIIDPPEDPEDDNPPDDDPPDDDNT